MVRSGIKHGICVENAICYVIGQRRNMQTRSWILFDLRSWSSRSSDQSITQRLQSRSLHHAAVPVPVAIVCVVSGTGITVALEELLLIAVVGIAVILQTDAETPVPVAVPPVTDPDPYGILPFPKG